MMPNFAGTLAAAGAGMERRGSDHRGPYMTACLIGGRRRREVAWNAPFISMTGLRGMRQIGSAKLVAFRLFGRLVAWGSYRPRFFPAKHSFSVPGLLGKKMADQGRVCIASDVPQAIMNTPRAVVWTKAGGMHLIFPAATGAFEESGRYIMAIGRC